jgi:hypothetical protein
MRVETLGSPVVRRPQASVADGRAPAPILSPERGGIANSLADFPSLKAAVFEIAAETMISTKPPETIYCEVEFQSTADFRKLTARCIKFFRTGLVPFWHLELHPAARRKVPRGLSLTPIQSLDGPGGGLTGSPPGAAKGPASLLMSPWW